MNDNTGIASDHKLNSKFQNWVLVTYAIEVISVGNNQIVILRAVHDEDIVIGVSAFSFTVRITHGQYLPDHQEVLAGRILHRSRGHLVGVQAGVQQASYVDQQADK